MLGNTLLKVAGVVGPSPATQLVTYTLLKRAIALLNILPRVLKSTNHSYIFIIINFTESYFYTMLIMRALKLEL